ncbi:MAG: non-canonical purine NTP pyrophosphatase, RdgB/HAM1 family [Rhodospirillaceae bacterium]|nr:non-canonical purine NTP pyrophosphatase, RdgB/HAM1 family [Rhodospirillaceae bacterium]
MTRRLTEGPLVVATHNQGKAKEIAALLAPFRLEVKAAGDLGLPEPEETGATFIDNAVIKARAAAEKSGLPALADDSGLAVHGLDGSPGIYSARWAGPGKDFAVAMARVETELGDNPDRGAHFVCALALAWPDGHVETFQGEVHGRLVFPGRGTQGFGYDPIFTPDGYDQTFGEMDPEAKDRISHRAAAFRQLVEHTLGPDGPR